MSKRFTEGIAFDGTAILDNGKPITITEILNNLNKLDKLKSNKECITDENKLLPCPFCGGKAEIKQTGRLKLKLSFLVTELEPNGGDCPVEVTKDERSQL